MKVESYTASPATVVHDEGTAWSVCVNCGYVVQAGREALLREAHLIWRHVYAPGAMWPRTIECTPWRTLAHTIPTLHLAPVPDPPRVGGWAPRGVSLPFSVGASRAR